MIYLNTNIINKIGNSNKLYYNGSIVYQGYTTGGEPDTPDIPDGDYSLPDVPFLFNYNAKNYSNGVIPNADGALFNYNMVLNNPNVVVYNGDYIAVNGESYFQYQYPSINENPFNCGSSNSQMTIIAKVRTNREDGQMHLFANRSDTDSYGGTYNWMLRIGGSCDVAWLHSANYSDCSNTVRVPITYDQPNIFAIRLLSDNKGYGQNYTLNEVDEVRDAGFTDYSYSSRIAILNGSFSGENFFGDFYWLYCSKEQLTDEQIQQVIEYNEGKQSEPVIPDVPVEPEPDEPETPEIPEIPSEVTEFEISSWGNTYSSVGEYEMTFMGDGFTIIVDFLVNPITPSTYSLDNGLSNDYTKYNGGNMESCTAIVIDNGDTLNFDVTFIADNINGHFNYSINKNEI